MKNQILLYILMLSSVTFNCWAQQNKAPVSKKQLVTSKTSATTMNKNVNSNRQKIKYYHVEEITSLKFGGHKTEYDVVNPKVINTYDLGPEGKRTITPVYGNEDPISEVVIKQNPIVNNKSQSKITVSDTPKKKDFNPSYQVSLKKDTLLNVKSQSKIVVSEAPKKTDSYAYVDIIKTYERMNDKGYVSIDMLKKIGNSYFFNDDFEKAEKCYNKLFSMTTNLEPDYYYRYSIILKSMGDNQKSDEYLKKFNQLSSLSSR
jgi:tetratricopeptide (TPR) repeat protein